MNITNFLDRQVRLESHADVVNTSEINDVMLRMESAFSSLVKAKGILNAATRHSLNMEEIKLGHHTLTAIPSEFQPKGMRMEGFAVTTEGLKYRTEGILSSIGDAIAKFFKWIGEAFSNLFGSGSGGDSGGGSGATAADATTTATNETIETASSNGLDEFLFKENDPMFKVLDIGDLPRCHAYYDAVISSSKALVEIHGKAIELSKKASKEYKGDFNSDVVKEIMDFAVPKSSPYCKDQIKEDGLPSKNYFAFPVKFLKARAICFTDKEIVTPSGSEAEDSTVKGFTAKDVYVSVANWKKLSDHYAQYTKAFFDAEASIGKLAEGYKALAAQVKDWTALEPEEVKNVGKGLTQMNRVATFVLNSVKGQEVDIGAMSTALKTVAENSLRKQAEAGRKKEADDAKAKADAEAKAKEGANKPTANTGNKPSTPKPLRPKPPFKGKKK